MKRFVVLLISGMLIGTTASAQPGPDTLWTRTYGWTGDDTAFSLQQTADGGFIIAGTATVVGPPAQTDMFLMKTDSLGLMQGWHTYGGPRDEGAYGVAQTNDGWYVVAGYATYDSANQVPYILCVNPVGILSWARYQWDDWQQPRWGRASSIERTADNNFVVAMNMLYVGPVQWRYITTVRVVNASGTWQGNGWGHDTYAPYVYNHAHQDSYGNCIAAGMSNELPLPVAVFWTSHYTYGFFFGGNPYEDEAFDVVQTTDGYLLAGRTYDGQYDGIFLCKTTALGDTIWLHRYVTEDGQWATTIIPATGGGYVIAGTCGTYWGTTDMLLAKINETGAIVWQSTYGTEGNERAYDVVQTADGGFVLCGLTDSHQGVGTEWYIVKTLPDPQLSSEKVSIQLPQEYRITAFPNPFNPSTQIAYSLPKAGQVSLKVFNLLGEEVITLVNEMQSAGTHAAFFDGSALPSGIYLCRLQVGNFAETKKMVLLK